MADAKRPSLDVEDRPERGTRAAKRLRREGYVPGVVYGGKNGDCTSFKVNARVLRQVMVGGAAFAPLYVCAAVLLGWLGVCFAIASRKFRWQ